jgi:hypothetical protein
MQFPQFKGVIIARSQPLHVAVFYTAFEQRRVAGEKKFWTKKFKNIFLVKKAYYWKFYGC